MTSNKSFFFSTLLFLFAVVVYFVTFPSMVKAEPFVKGAKLCEECHEEEFKVWSKTKHFKSFRSVHREPKDASKPSPKKILKAVGGQKRMKRNKTCYLCHYTLQKKDAGAKHQVKSGTSCESCHGASSDYMDIHGDYGGKDVKREAESADHKAKRIADSKAAGLIWPSMKYEIAENCMTCHGLANPDLKADDLAKMLGAGHPINPEFELVKYSQGSVRHRHYPPNMKTNAEMTPKEQAEFFVIGQAAALVSATSVMSKSSEAKYIEAQKTRAENAKAALAGVAEAADLLASPSRANALKLAAAIAGKDLTGAVGSKLPAKGDYK
ncbi:cytochrome c family protein [Nitrospinaceae bacterium]|nr:cytochrome c family protein [Nitrospinaceae bacterium]